MSIEKNVTTTKAESSEPSHPTHEAIATRAYEIAERQGFPCGCDLAHWLQAETELMPGTAQACCAEGRPQEAANTTAT